MKKSNRTVKAKKTAKATKQSKFFAIAVQPIAFVSALVAKIVTLFK